MNRPEPEIEEGLKLPFDIRTLIAAIKGRWWQFILIGVIAVGAAYDLGHRLGSASYLSHTMLLYAPAADTNVEMGESTFLRTHLNMIKIPENLESLRDELQLAVSMDAVAGAVDAEIQKNTGLMVISGTWDTADGAAKVANTMRNIFLRRHVELMGAGETRALEHQRGKKQKELESVQKQLKELTRLGKEIRARMSEDLAANPEEEGLGDLNIRIERIRDAIAEDQSYRANLAKLGRMEVDLARTEQLAADGLIAQSAVEKARAEYEAQKAVTIDTEKTAEWREELERLQSAAMPSASSPTSPSAPVLQEMLLKEFNFELQIIELGEAIAQLDSRLAEVKQALAEIYPYPKDQAAGLNFFRIVSDAEPPIWAESSSKKLIAIAVAVLLFGFGSFVILSRVLTDRRILSRPDAKAKLGIQTLVGWRRGHLNSALKSIHDDFLLMANQLRPFAGESRCFLIVGVEEDKLHARTVGQLAAAAAQLGERVLVINGSTRSSMQPHLEKEINGHKLIFGLDEAIPGLRDGQSVFPDAGSIQAGTLHILGNGGRIPRPEELSSLKFRALLEEARNLYSMVIVIGPDPSTTRQVVLLAENCDKTMIVLRASRMKAGKIKTALEPLLAEPEKLNVILGEIKPRFASLSDAA